MNEYTTLSLAPVRVNQEIDASFLHTIVRYAELLGAVQGREVNILRLLLTVLVLLLAPLPLSMIAGRVSSTLIFWLTRTCQCHDAIRSSLQRIEEITLHLWVVFMPVFICSVYRDIAIHLWYEPRINALSNSLWLLMFPYAITLVHLWARSALGVETPHPR
jgi:hypothetical protein